MRNKDKFEFFRMGMVSGLIEREVVIKWADHELISSDKPDHEVIDLSLAGHLPYSQIIGLLNTFQGNPDHKLPVYMVLAHALVKSKNNILDAVNIILGIRLIKAEANIDKEIIEGLTSLEEALKDHTNGNLPIEELHHKLQLFLNHYSKYQKEIDGVFNTSS
jgi:hypothetical protein